MFQRSHAVQQGDHGWTYFGESFERIASLWEISGHPRRASTSAMGASSCQAISQIACSDKAEKLVTDRRTHARQCLLFPLRCMLTDCNIVSVVASTRQACSIGGSDIEMCLVGQQLASECQNCNSNARLHSSLCTSACQIQPGRGKLLCQTGAGKCQAETTVTANHPLGHMPMAAYIRSAKPVLQSRSQAKARMAIRCAMGVDWQAC